MTVWTNDDGLPVRFGLDAAETQREGSPAQSGPYKTLIAEIVAADLPAVGTSDFINHEAASCFIPKGAILKSATLEVTEAFAGATGTLSLGTAQKDGTVIDADGIDATIAVTAIDAVGDSIACDGALVGAVASSSVDSYLTVLNGTADFTAGKAKLILEILHPVE